MNPKPDATLATERRFVSHSESVQLGVQGRLTYKGKTIRLRLNGTVGRQSRGDREFRLWRGFQSEASSEFQRSLYCRAAARRAG